MFFVQPYHNSELHHKVEQTIGIRQALNPRMDDSTERRPTAFIPTVYENVTPEPARWEYHVLSVDAREAALPDVEQLNELGREGWVMIGVLDERATGRGGLVYYYFTRAARG
ncbi:hypothetical protein EPA93_18650 [Ktedonosporobacter rubrisoli]|uniref:DUF4177 domain-containing protein n=1 Tax=Ktedonosporobacter rubrisoli TaxID=2509675 RepID=A0A4P6JRE3_KTERU|nr:hypothetical protein [Ktedonosporobacter rubrisoli]QBD77904.1 hypothetical protein EPA93_18650 [Ktedonosporobacter rubrisoli]